MLVPDLLADVFKPGLDLQLGFRRSRLRPRFVDLIEPVGLDPADHAPQAVAPAHFQAHLIGQTAGGKDPHGVVAGQIAAPADHFLALHRHRAPVEPELGPDAPGVGRPALQTHRHARGNPLVAIDPRRPIEIVDHQVQVPVPVQVRQGHAVRDGARVEAPGLADLLERQVSPIPKRHLRNFEAAVHLPQIELFERREFFRRPDLLAAPGHIRIHRVEFVAGSDQQILVAIQIDIEENRRPGPFRGSSATQTGDLGIGPVTAIQEQGVPRVLRAVFDFADGQIKAGQIADLVVALLMVGTQHVQDEEVVKTVAIDVGKIDAHGKNTRVAQGQAGNGPKSALAGVDPDAVGRLEIVADINIGSAIAIQVSEHHR